VTSATDRIRLGNQDYVTAAGAVTALNGEDADTVVTIAMVRAWARRRRLTTARLDGHVYYPLAALTRAEQATDESRATAGGRPRPKILTSA
jgi:hypothetical protein